MKDDTGHVTVPGYYDHVKLGEAERKIMAAVPEDEMALKKRVGIYRADQAVAELDLRTTPDSNAVYFGKLVQAHLEKQGYHLVKGTPTDDDRSRYDRLAMQIEDGDAADTPMDSVVWQWAYGAMADAFGAQPGPVRIRMRGGTISKAEIVEARHIPFAIVPFVNADNNQYASTENMRMGNYIDGLRICT